MVPGLWPFALESEVVDILGNIKIVKQNKF